MTFGKAVRTALKFKNKLGFIEETLKKLVSKEGEDTPKLHAWEMANSMIRSWILNFIDPKLRASIAYNDTTEFMWQNLNKLYAVSDAPKIHQPKQSWLNVNKVV